MGAEVNGAGAVYRAQAKRDERPDVEPLHKGPRHACPACGVGNVFRCPYDGDTKPWTFGAMPTMHPYAACKGTGHMMVGVMRVTAPAFCSPASRIRIGWFRRCKVPGEHTHQACRACGASWLCAPVEVVGQ